MILGVTVILLSASLEMWSSEVAAPSSSRKTAYQTSIEWSVSERGGWSTFLYDT